MLNNVCTEELSTLHCNNSCIIIHVHAFNNLNRVPYNKCCVGTRVQLLLTTKLSLGELQSVQKLFPSVRRISFFSISLLEFPLLWETDSEMVFLICSLMAFTHEVASCEGVGIVRVWVL